MRRAQVLRRGADRRGDRPDSAAEFGIQWQVPAEASPTSSIATAFGGTNFGRPSPATTSIRLAQNPSGAGNGPQPRHHQRHGAIPGLGVISNLGAPGPRARERRQRQHPVHADAADARQRGSANLVGQNVPFVTGQYATGRPGDEHADSTGHQPFQTIERKDVGLMLRVKPQITEGGTVRMQSTRKSRRVEPTGRPARRTRSPTSARSNRRCRRRRPDRRARRPDPGPGPGRRREGAVLGDIPALGACSATTSRKRSKTNLMVFLRPTVLRDAQRSERRRRSATTTCAASSCRCASRTGRSAVAAASAAAGGARLPRQPTLTATRHRHAAGTPAVTADCNAGASPDSATRAGTASR